MTTTNFHANWRPGGLHVTTGGANQGQTKPRKVRMRKKIERMFAAFYFSAVFFCSRGLFSGTQSTVARVRLQPVLLS